MLFVLLIPLVLFVLLVPFHTPTLSMLLLLSLAKFEFQFAVGVPSSTATKSMDVPIASGKGAISRNGLRWGKMFDPSFVPAKDSALLPREEPKPANHPKPAVKVAKKSVVSGVCRDEDVEYDGKPQYHVEHGRHADENGPELYDTRTHSLDARADHSSKPAFASSALTPDQRSVYTWLTGELSMDLSPEVRRGVASCTGKSPVFTATTLGQLMR